MTATASSTRRASTPQSALGYDAQLRLARVGDPQQAPRTHLAVVATIDGTRYLSDPGIGVPPLGPIELGDGARLEGGIWEHEIRRVDEGGAGPAWQLWRQRAKGWQPMHSTDELPVCPVDVVMGHHYTSTHPALDFTRTLTVARHHVDADGRAVHMTLTLDGLQIRRAGRRRGYGRWQTRRSPRCVRRSALTSPMTKGDASSRG